MGYCSIEDVRARGVLEEDISDSTVARFISIASAVIDQSTGMWFVLKDVDLVFDGNGSHILYLPAPAESVSTLEIDSELISAVDFIIYGGHQDIMANRLRPRIELKSETLPYLTPLQQLSETYRTVFTKGVANVHLAGKLGFVEDEDGTTPVPIQECCLDLVLALCRKMLTSWDDPLYGKFFKSEHTDKYSYTLGDFSTVIGTDRFLEITNILKSYTRAREIGGAAV